MKNLLLILFLPIISFTQDGPAGVGNTYGNSSLVIWLNANKVNQDSLSNVGLWFDNSGYKNHGHIDAGLGPVLKNDAVNHNKVLNFNGNRHEYLVISSDSTIETNELSLYVVGKITPESSPWAGFILKNSGKSWDDGYGISRYDNDNEFIGYTNNFKKFGLKAPLEFNKYSILSLHHSIDSLKFFKDGGLLGSLEHIGEITQNDDVFWIGWTGEFLDGEIAEIIMFNKFNSLIQRRFIHNYLSSKYNIEIEEDLYAYDDPIHGNYDYNLNGIGLAEDTSSQLNDHGEGMVNINNPSDLDLNEYMLWANNGVDLDQINTSDVPEEIILRLGREWRVSENDIKGKSVDLGSVDVQFDISKLNSNPLDLVLLIDNNNDGFFANDQPIKVTSIIEGRIISFKGITNLKDGSRFTIGSSSKKTSNLLPFLNYFKLIYEKDIVNVKWKITTNDIIQTILLQKTDESKYSKIILSMPVDENPGFIKEFSFKDQEMSEFNTVYSLLGLMENGDTIKLESIGMDFLFEKSKYNQIEKAEELQEKDQEIDQISKELLWTIIYALLFISVLLLIVIYFKSRSVKLENHRKELLYQIDQLKQKAAASSLSEPENRKEMELDKEKLELTIDSKIGESAWRILNLILIDPTISNKEIAEEVSLSLEGVSSSLRKMYTVFNITTSSNKKIALIMEVIKISSNT